MCNYFRIGPYLWQCLDVIQLSPYCMPLLIFFPVSLACKKPIADRNEKWQKKFAIKKETVCVTTRANFFAALERLQRFCSGLFSALFAWFVERSKEKRRSIRRSADWIHRHNGKTAIIFFSNYSFINFYTHDLISSFKCSIPIRTANFSCQKWPSKFTHCFWNTVMTSTIFLIIDM